MDFFHSTEFDNGTICKLEIFNNYIEVWLAVFIKQSYTSNIYIYDFFSGPGADSKGVFGTPLRILNSIIKLKSLLRARIEPFTIHLHFNDYDSQKVAKLKELIKELPLSEIRNYINIVITDDEFKPLFSKLKNQLSNNRNLILIDQYGLNNVSIEVFHSLCCFKKTDFLFFSSSSIVRRFGDCNFRELFPKMDFNKLNMLEPNKTHEFLCEYYRSIIPTDCETRIYPFSIKKPPNYYGIIFGSNHVYGAQKFLDVAWNYNNINGCANYDIYNDTITDPLQGRLFDIDEPTTKESFETLLSTFILTGNLKTNKDVYLFTLDNGFIPTHSTSILKKLKKNKVIHYNAMGPLVRWEYIKPTRNRLITYERIT